MSSHNQNSSRNSPPKAGNSVQKFSRFKRIKNYWEVIYEPSARAVTKEYDWDTGNTTGVKYCICDAKSLTEKMTSRGAQRWKVQGFSFRYCDFIGTYPEGVTFKDCEFEACDLGLTTWKNVKFTDCKFKKTSLTLATFEYCQFLNCTWIDISVSGTETKMLDTTISNAESFVSAAYTNLDLETLKQFSKDPQFQKMRLEETKLKLARTIMICNERHGDDGMYYEAIKTYLVQSLRARQEKIKYKMLTDKKSILDSIRCKFLSMEAWMLKVSGSINGWGSSLSRPAVVGLGIVVLYALLYWALNVKADVFKAAMAAFDVTLLVGYTKHAKEESEWISQILYACNALFGLWWYAIFVPTVINRISRVR